MRDIWVSVTLQVKQERFLTIHRAREQKWTVFKMQDDLYWSQLNYCQETRLAFEEAPLEPARPFFLTTNSFRGASQKRQWWSLINRPRKRQPQCGPVTLSAHGPSAPGAHLGRNRVRVRVRVSTFYIWLRFSIWRLSSRFVHTEAAFFIFIKY